MEQTAVEWFYDQLIEYPLGDWEYFLKQAKQMEKEQMIDAWKDGNAIEFYDETDTMAINYYNKTYGVEK